MEQKECIECKKSLPLESFGSNGESSSGKLRHKPRCKLCNVAYEQSIFRSKMERIVGKMECSTCGYTKCLAALEFHHINPSEKESIIGRMKNYSEARLQREISKCVILCANCHREEHERLRTT